MVFMKCSEDDFKSRLQGLVCDGVIHGLGRSIQGSLCTESGLFENGQLVHGYRATALYTSYGHYNRQGLLTGRGFRSDIVGTFLFGTFKEGLLHGTGLVLQSGCFERIYWGKFEHGSLVYGFMMPAEDCYYFGPFYNYEPDGDGVDFYSDGATFGNWSMGMKTCIYHSIIHPSYPWSYVSTHSQISSLDISFELIDIQARFEFMTMIVCRIQCSQSVQATYAHCVLTRRILLSFAHRYMHMQYMPDIRHQNLHFYSDGAIVSILDDGPNSVFLFPPNSKFSHFIGNVENKQFSGEGTLFTKNGTRITAYWNKTFDIESNYIPDNVQILFPNKNHFAGCVGTRWLPIHGCFISRTGRMYKGEFKNYNMHGKGKLICRSNTVIAGSWNSGVIHERCTAEVCRPYRWSALLQYEKGSPSVGFVLHAQEKNVYAVDFSTKHITKLSPKLYGRNHLVTLKKQLCNTQRKLGAFAQQSKQECCSQYTRNLTSSMNLFHVCIRQVTQEGIDVTIWDFTSESKPCYFIKVIPADALDSYNLYDSYNSPEESPSYPSYPSSPKIMKTRSRYFTIRDIDSNKIYSVSSGIVKYKTNITLQDPIFVRAPPFVTYSNLVSRVQMHPFELHQELESRKCTRFSIDHFPQFVKEIARLPTTLTRVGYDEKTSTFVVCSLDNSTHIFSSL